MKIHSPPFGGLRTVPGDTDIAGRRSTLPGMSQCPPCPKARLILLGASNLTRGISTVIETARLMLGSPLEVLAALGHGRSYGMHSRVMGRGLPSILECGLWDAIRESLATRPELATFALITDIGNDLVYGVEPRVIEQWVETCIDRLEASAMSGGPGGPKRIAITTLPIESVRSLSRAQFLIVRSILFPTRRMTYEEAIGRSHELHERIIDLIKRRGLTRIDLPGDWYGIDPIHIRARHWPRAWRQILAPCLCPDNDKEISFAQRSFSRWLRLRTRTPERWWLLGMQRGRAQPCGTLRDGTTIALY
jgi:hypothetical protein